MKSIRLFGSFGLWVALLQVNAIQAQSVKTGPAVGQLAPDFSAQDQADQTQTLRSILGPKGAMLVFFRSADW
jgi:hypothetical protein